MFADEVTQSSLSEDITGHLGVGVGQRRDARLRRSCRARSRRSCQLHPAACTAAALAGTARRAATTHGFVTGRPYRASTVSGYRASAAAAVATAEYIHRQSEHRMKHPSIRFSRWTRRVSRAFFKNAWSLESGSTAWHSSGRLFSKIFTFATSLTLASFVYNVSDEINGRFVILFKLFHISMHCCINLAADCFNISLADVRRLLFLLVYNVNLSRS